MTKNSEGSQVNAVYKSIRGAILDGRYPPGSPLRLKMLADDHGGSYIPIREALRLLEVERLVETTPNKGARVRELSLEDLVDSYSTRTVLEVDALKRAADHLTPSSLRRLSKLNDEMNQAFVNGDVESGLGAHRRLHFGIYELSSSEWLIHLITILWDHTERYRRLATDVRTPDDIAHEHGSIVTALTDGDVEVAAQALTDHLTHTTEVVLTRFSDMQSPDPLSGNSG